MRPQLNTFIIYKGVVAYAISQLHFDMITLKLESHAVSHAMSSAFVLVKKQNLESSTSFLFLCLKRPETRKAYKYKFHMQPSLLPSTQGRMYPSTFQTLPPSRLHPPPSPFMKIATWDVKGAGNARFCLNVQDLINAYGLDILVILEPRISGNHAEHVISHVGLPRHFLVDPIGLSDGI